MIEEVVKVVESDFDFFLDDFYLDVYVDDNMEGYVICGCDNWLRYVMN